MDQYIGKLLDNRYEIQQVIGVGGMAVVYKALCHRLNRPVAVKILKDEYSQDEDFRRRFHAESQAVAMLSHPNIVSVYDVSHADGADYIVMELIDGINLKQYLEQRGALNWREVLHFSTQICKALEHAHSRGIIHRDIKPHNIMLLKDGSVKVADFGIAGMVAQQTTVTGAAFGSVHYISPEQAKGGKPDSRSDLYSLGIMMYEMLTGRVPYDGQTPVAVVVEHLSGEAVMPRQIDPTIPAGLEYIAMRAMQASVENRYGSAEAMLADLEAFRQNPNIVFPPLPSAVPRSGRTAPQTAEPESEPVKKKKKKKGTLALLIGILCILLVAGAFGYAFYYLIGDLFYREPDIEIPELRLSPVEGLAEKYEGKFVITVDDWVYDDEVASGLVLSQEPKSGKMVKPGAEITVTASLGAEQKTMPDVTNRSLQDAELILSEYDVNVKQTYEVNNLYVEGFVIRANPAFGTMLTPGQTVELIVSQKEKVILVPVPQLVGKPVEDAELLLEQAGLQRGAVNYSSSDKPKGTVIQQSVRAGTEVKESTAISMQVSSGLERKAVSPTILLQPSSQHVILGEEFCLNVEAFARDAGVISYEWFASETSSADDLVSVGSEPELLLFADRVGEMGYCCKITNTLGESTASIYTKMVRITVEEPTLVTLTFDVPLPDTGTEFEITVKLDGTVYGEPFTVAVPERTEEEEYTEPEEEYTEPEEEYTDYEEEYTEPEENGENDEDGPRTVTVAVEAFGTHVVDIYVDGILALSETADFTA